MSQSHAPKVVQNEGGLIFRLSDQSPDIIRQILLERGWTQYDENEADNDDREWNLWWRTQRFRKSDHIEVADWQRLNHFPKTDAITRKDCLVRNLRRMRCVYGPSMYDFHPPSYILPNEYTKFVSDYAKRKEKDTYWICKPTDSSRGRGIFIFKDLKDLNYDCPVIVQKYISTPLLISGYKFDLRIYVCVPSFQPLNIYIYQEGIVRFGTDKFDLTRLENVFSHLTNTSINKYGPAYSADKERVGPGCKWTLTQLRHFLRQMENVDEILLWQRIKNIVTLTIATQAPTVPKSRNCFELFGFDILIDENFKPWLLEVNFSPALNMDCQTDFIAKHSMLNDLIDLLNFKDADADRGGEAYRECKKISTFKYKKRRNKILAGSFESTTHSSSFGKPQSLEKSMKEGLVAKGDPFADGRLSPESMPQSSSSMVLISHMHNEDRRGMDKSSKQDRMDSHQEESMNCNIRNTKKRADQVKSNCQERIGSALTSCTQSEGRQKRNTVSQQGRKYVSASYKSPYSIESTRLKTSGFSNPWPRTRVGDFVLAFPWNEAMRKASGTDIDMKSIVREMQRIMKKISPEFSHDTNGTTRRRNIAKISKSEAIELSFSLKFEKEDSNPLYFWGPQHPPLLSSVLS